MGLVGNEQIQLGVLLDLDAQLVQTLDGRVAGKEVLRTRAEGDDLQILHTDDGMKSAIIFAMSSAVPTGYSGM